MRKQPKSFTIEVKRRPTSLARKAAPLVEPPAPAPEPAVAAALFGAPARTEAARVEAERRILPCLVTEAAIDAARTEALSHEAVAPRPRGRPRKQRAPDELAPLAPRKRGRPRKAAAVEPVDVEPVVYRAPARAAVAAKAPPPSARTVARRAAVSELPRGERWKRRLPKSLR